jgi:tetratricopeptide (TPR) repeat protein
MRTRKKIIAVSAGWLILTSGMGFARAGEGGVKSASGVAADLIQAESGEEARNPFVNGLDSEKRCTIIYASDGRTALAGNNEDWSNPFPIIWFQPAEDGKFGCMFFGFQTIWPRSEWPQREGGMNEMGLFYDFASAEEVNVPRDPNKPDPDRPLMAKVMEECSNVEEALKVFTEYNFGQPWKGHYLIGDRFGNSAIIEPLTFIRKSRKYQVATNFFQSKTDPETSTDARYRRASELFEQSDTISVSLFRRILNDTHFEDYGGSCSATLYSYICDLATADVHIYNFHNYDHEVILNIHEELKKGRHTYLISSLFPYETYAARQYKATRMTVMLLQNALQNGITGEEAAIAFYKGVNSPDDTLIKYSLGEEHLTAVGYALLQYNKVNDAIELFTFMVEEFPQSANAYDSLAEAYMKAGNKERAVENYKKSLELNPDNDNAQKMLEQLQK